jgi:hypothetical protein
MTNFVTDGTALAFPKADLNPLPGSVDPAKAITGADWNLLCQAALDLRAYVLAGATNNNAWAFLGDSNTLDQGVTTDKAVRWNAVVDASNSLVTDQRATINTIYGTAVNEPIALVDLGTTTLRAHNASSFPGYGQERSFGPGMFDLLNGVGATPTTANRPLLMVFGISGVDLKQMLPASTYGQATPAFGGLNAYGAWKARTLALLAIAGRKLGGVTITLGGNDTSNGTDSAAVGANMVTLATQIRVDFGAQVAIIWVKLNALANVDTTNRATVRAQMVLGAAAIPGCKLVGIDTYPLNGDGLHYGADPTWDMGLQYLDAMRAAVGLIARSVTQPTVIGYGTPAFNNAGGALAPRGYPLSRYGDTEVMFVAAMKNSGTAVASSTWTASGWTLVASAAQAISGQAQEIALFTRNVLQADLDGNDGLPAAASVTTGNDENYAVRLTVRGPKAFPTLDGSVVSFLATGFASSAVNASGPTTTGTNSLVMTLIAGQGGGPSLTEHFAVSNANTLPSILIDAPLPQNTTNYGLLAVGVGTKAAAGAVGTTVVTPSITTNPSGFTVAFQS